ncbi:MAG: hypothetical protein Q4B36_00365 [Tissierellia bacterium]|nr:hypothetical protein [Tissierellia bacterium]
MSQINSFDESIENNLVNLKILESKMQLELFYLILSFERLEKEYENGFSKSIDYVFTKTQLDLREEIEYISFLERSKKNNYKNIDKYNSNKKMLDFAKYIESLNSMSKEELFSLKDKMEFEIEKLKTSISEVDLILLGNLPKSELVC